MFIRNDIIQYQKHNKTHSQNGDGDDDCSLSSVDYVVRLNESLSKIKSLQKCLCWQKMLQ